MSWYVTYGGERHGPLQEQEVRERWASGHLPADTLVWDPSRVDWEPAHQRLTDGPPPLPAAAPPPPSAAPAPAAQHRVQVGQPYASLGRRLAAVVVDTALLYLFLMAVAMLLTAMEGALGAAAPFVTVLLQLASMVFIVVWPLMSLGRLGQTYGKHLLDVAVVRVDDGQPIGTGSALGRGFIQSLGLYVLGLGWLWATWDHRRQSWHDKAAGSVVVSRPSSPKMNPFEHVRATFRRA